MRLALRALTAVLLALVVGLIARRSGRADGRRWLRAADQRLEEATLRSPAGAWVYARVAPRIFRRLYADVVARARDASARSVLDVGSGPGELAIRLARRLRTGQVIGIDPSAAMIEVAASRAAQLGPTPVAVHFVRAVAEQLPFPSDSFDLVVSTAALHHFRDPGRALNEAWRVLRPGGRLLLYDLAPVTYGPAELRSIAQSVSLDWHGLVVDRPQGGWARWLFVRYTIEKPPG